MLCMLDPVVPKCLDAEVSVHPWLNFGVVVKIKLTRDPMIAGSTPAVPLWARFGILVAALRISISGSP